LRSPSPVADVLVTRDIHSDLDEGKRQIQFRKGWLHPGLDMVMKEWYNSSHDVFYAERFLKRDSDTGEDVFTMTWVSGRFFQFGGGKTVCPGRVFAAVAMVLLNYDIQPLDFLDGQGKQMDEFPELAKSLARNGILAMEGDMRVKMKRRL
jgi:hypothetical protein